MQHAPELGFVFKAVIIDAIAQNSTRGTLWAVYLDEKPVGAAMIGSRRPYHHVYRTGDVTVVKEYRRKRLGTCLYTATAMQGILEGRREVEETVIASLSPWMVYSGDSDTIVGEQNYDGQLSSGEVRGSGFLRSLNYKYYGTLPKRTSGFRDIQLWCHDPSEIDDYLSRLPEQEVVIELATNAEHDNDVFDKNIENYKQHEPELVSRFEILRSWLREGADGLVRPV